MSPPIKVLVLEDRPEDAELAIHELKRSGLNPDWKCVETGPDFLTQLSGYPDIILADYSLPDFSALAALEIVQNKGLDIPLIVMTGAVGDEAAVECISKGAADFLLKDRLGRLGQSVTNVLKAKQLRLEKNAAIKALEQAEKKYRNIFENAAEAIFQIHPKGNILTSNPAAARMFGYSSEADMVGGISDVKKQLFASPRTFINLQKKLDARQDISAAELQLRRLNGSLLWVSISIRAVRDDANQIELYEAIAQNITERRKAEEHIREQANLLDLTADAIVVRDMDEKVQFWNKGAEKLFELEANEVMGTSVSQPLYEDRLAVISAKEQILKTGYWTGELQLADTTNDPRYVNSRWTLVRNETGHPKSILTIDTDITEHRTLERQFLRAQRMESIGTLASGIAHDLNNVLTPILASASILKSHPSERMIEKTIKTIETSTHRGAEIIKQVLTFARGIDGDRKILTIKPIADEVVRMARKTFPKDITVYQDIPDTLWLFEADLTQVEQIILNLCINARDAMPVGGIITVCARNTRLAEKDLRLHPEIEPGPFLCLEVRDTGTGVPKEIAEKIFEPFFTTKQPGHGTGLGLATIVGILKSHGGFVRLGPAEVGACFQILFPAAISATSDDVADLDIDIEMGSGEKVLVVDDESSVLEITQTILEGSGYEALVCRNGKEALIIYEEEKDSINAVMTDLMMPVMDGENLIKELKQRDPNLNIMAFSGALSEKDGSERISELKKLGIKAFLQKPFTAEALLKTIHETIE